MIISIFIGIRNNMVKLFIDKKGAQIGALII